MKESNKSSHIKMKRLKKITNLSRRKKHSFTPFLPIIAILFLSITTISIVTLINNKKKLLDSSTYTEEITSISFASDDWETNGPGSWHLDKSTKWTDLDTAQIDFEIKSTAKYDEKRRKDVVLILDISGSMRGEKLEKVIEDSKELVETLLTGKGNRVALVVFESSAEVESYFVSDDGKDTMLALLDGLSASGGTNYNDALKKLEDILIEDNYTTKSDTDLIALFLTDGHPETDTPKEIATYKALKDNYPYLHIHGISYETGIRPLALERISEKLFYANRVTLRNVLFEASFPAQTYEKFQVIDYVEDKYFYVKDASDITVSIGTVEVIDEDNTQKIVWTLSPEYITGQKATMSIKLYLKEEYIDNKNQDLYSSNKGEEVISKLPPDDDDDDDDEKVVKDDRTPVIKRLYDVIYESNAPSGCNGLDLLTIEQHQAFEIINMKNKELTCSGYLFKGWEIITEDVQKINSDTFQMPTKNVTLTAVWSKISIAKSMEGIFYTRPTLYDMVKSNAMQNNNKYSDIVTDVYNKTETADIYYYTNIDSNNVLYAGFCWQIVRTTTTGGVKLVYNGLPDSNGTCTTNTTYNGEIGIVGDYPRLIDLRYEYWYGDSFDYDENTKTFTIEGTKYKGNYSSDSNKDNYLRKYTCKSDDESNACSTMFYISAVGTGEDNAYAAPYTIQNQFYHGNIAFSDFNANAKSLAFVGYMYNTTYITNQGTTPVSIFGNDVTWNPLTKQYELSSDTSTSYDDTHHYACNDTTCSSVRFFYYRHGAGNNYLHYIVLENGKKINDALYDMIGYIDSNSTNKQPNANLNKYNSDVKSLIDWWFEKYIQNQQDDNGNGYTNYLEDVVYCNDRSVSDLAGWSQNSSIAGRADPRMYFNTYNYHVKSTLECPNVTDQFSTNNSYAQLKYPVGLLTAPEANLMTEALRGNRAEYWLGSPSDFYESNVEGNTTGKNGGFYQIYVTTGKIGLRPVVSLKPGTEFSAGDGTKEDPFVVNTPSKSA